MYNSIAVNYVEGISEPFVGEQGGFRMGRGVGRLEFCSWAYKEESSREKEVSTCSIYGFRKGIGKNLIKKP